MRTNAELVLQALIFGLEVKIDPYTYVLGQDASGKPSLSIVAEPYADDDLTKAPEKAYLRAGYTFDDFLVVADRLTREERFRLCAAFTLNQHLEPAFGHDALTVAASSPDGAPATTKPA
jgi:hypothetical protein